MELSHFFFVIRMIIIVFSTGSEGVFIVYIAIHFLGDYIYWLPRYIFHVIYIFLYIFIYIFFIHLLVLRWILSPSNLYVFIACLFFWETILHLVIPLLQYILRLLSSYLLDTVTFVLDTSVSTVTFMALFNVVVKFSRFIIIPLLIIHSSQWHL